MLAFGGPLADRQPKSEDLVQLGVGQVDDAVGIHTFDQGLVDGVQGGFIHPLGFPAEAYRVYRHRGQSLPIRGGIDPTGELLCQGDVCGDDLP